MNRHFSRLTNRALFTFSATIAVFFLAACSSAPREASRAPVEGRTIPQSQPAPTGVPTTTVVNGQTYHTVRPGDTLFGISQQYRVPVDNIVTANHLPDANQIHVGQRLLIPAGTTTRVANANAGTTTVTSGYQDDGGPKLVNVDNTQATDAGTTPSSTPPATTPTTSVATSTGTWMWPVQGGQVVGRFGTNNNKGIDIAAPKGTAVVASDSGKVIFSSNNIRGYGNLIVIRHSNNYLTAYGYNSKLLVKEGDTVKKGDKIAEVGDSGTDSPKLHFEIRNTNSKPEDPLRYLPPQ